MRRGHSTVTRAAMTASKPTIIHTPTGISSTEFQPSARCAAEGRTNPRHCRVRVSAKPLCLGNERRRPGVGGPVVAAQPAIDRLFPIDLDGALLGQSIESTVERAGTQHDLIL